MLLRCESLEPPMSQMGSNPDPSFSARTSPSAERGHCRPPEGASLGHRRDRPDDVLPAAPVNQISDRGLSAVVAETRHLPTGRAPRR
jgi:hypothetical protein